MKDFYDPLAGSPDVARRNGWGSTERQRLRLQFIRRSMGDLERVSTVLDAGCGEAQFLNLLRETGWQGQYLGEDLLVSMLSRAKSDHDDPNATFSEHDLHAPGPSADAVVCSGALNTVSSVDPHQEALSALDALWARTNSVLCLDFITHARHPGEHLLASLDPLILYAHARRLAPAARLREDVMPGEALIVMLRDRSSVLGDIPPSAAFALHLEAGELRAAEGVMVHLPPAELGLAKARIDCHAGRWRRAESRLRQMGGDPDARLLLASLLYGTNRSEEAQAITAELAARGGRVADEALALAHQHAPQSQREAIAGAIEDPWIRRAVLAQDDEATS